MLELEVLPKVGSGCRHLKANTQEAKLVESCLFQRSASEEEGGLVSKVDSLSGQGLHKGSFQGL